MHDHHKVCTGEEILADILKQPKYNTSVCYLAWSMIVEVTGDGERRRAEERRERNHRQKSASKNSRERIVTTVFGLIAEEEENGDLEKLVRSMGWIVDFLVV